MDTALGDTAGKLVGGAAQLIMRVGYNGFSYADLSERFGIRKASIHYHFPSKADLVVAVVEQARAGIQAQVAALDEGSPVALDQLRFYTGYWERCIKDQSAPFCLAAVLAAELPSLPETVAASVQGHFADLGKWLERLLELGVEQGSVHLDASPDIEAQAFMASVYGAMLAARAFNDPQRFHVIVETLFRRIRA
ncbi:TetR/AcrR family transcriptional regulator [Mesorhizobium sp. ASY16-5R]|uniref:TetR/AcrR family transcriptional regulator n=1 Tax=Mesorhizobium sp. ASY16-5R TaxID=3445772 RepID=UPI003F9FA701